LNKLTHNLISSKEIAMMKDHVMLVNTSRGGIIDELELYNGLESGKIASAAIDVFETEPYEGNLSLLDNCLITSHMGSMTEDCRARMEIEATQEAARFIKGDKLELAVPKDEYENFL
jgi:D-3-phosphoglycerate dehydrogenase